MTEAPFRRVEDERLVSGLGRYTADLPQGACLHAAFVRSPHAHARIIGLDMTEALAIPGVVAVIDAAALLALGIGDIPETNTVPPSPASLFVPARWPVLASQRVLYVGQCVAMVVARTAWAAQDGAEAVAVDYDAIDAVVGAPAALQADAPQLHEPAPGNLAARFAVGDAEAVAAAFANAAHVVTAQLTLPRVAAAPMEPRSALAEYDAASQRYTLIAPSQGVGILRSHMAGTLNVSPEQVRILSNDVGGGFGARAWCYPEYAALLGAARICGRQVRWVSSRNEAMMADTQGRGLAITARLALDAKGRFLALDVDNQVDLGAFSSSNAAFISCNNFVRSLVGPYRTPVIAARVNCAFTNTTPIGAYRGAGRPEGHYVVERLIDLAAHQCGFDRMRLRRLNMIPPGAMPYVNALGYAYDSGDFPRLIDTALVAAEFRSFKARQRAARRLGRHRGFGVGCFVEPAGGPPQEMARLSIDGDGRILVDIGGHSIGTSHASIFRDLAAQLLDLPAERCIVRQGDSDRHGAGAGSIASRSAVANGQALSEAAARLLAKARMLAGLLMQLPPDQLAYAGGVFSGPQDTSALDLAALDRHSRSTAGLPEEVAGGLACQADIAARPTFPNGCHVAEVEIDGDTGVVSLLRYVAVDDCGHVLNETVVAGQIHGGVVQGFGEAVLEQMYYDEVGQLSTGSFMDYGLPRAADVPRIETISQPTPCTTNPLGLKGAGESGTTGSLSAIMNAIFDALVAAGAAPVDMPCTPEKLWAALRAGTAES